MCKDGLIVIDPIYSTVLYTGCCNYRQLPEDKECGKCGRPLTFFGWLMSKLKRRSYNE